MAMLAWINNKERITLHKVIRKISDDEKEIAISIFNEYRQKGVVIAEFSDCIWKMTNEIDTVGLDFRVNEIFVKKYFKSCSLEKIVEILKCYICFCLGQYSLKSIRQILSNIKNAMDETCCFQKMPKRTVVLERKGVSDFISLFPFANEDLIIECIDYTHERHRRRTLAEYQSYFLFDILLDEFWESATYEEKDLYYPIYLWWKISMVIPIRVTEFSIIPKDCIYKGRNKWMLKIRRTNLKGKSGSIGYKLDEDYQMFEYAVTDEIASMIQTYKNRASKYDESEIDSIFSDDEYSVAAEPRFRCGGSHLSGTGSHQLLIS